MDKKIRPIITKFEVRLMYVSIIVALALGAYGAHQSNAKAYALCNRVEANRTALYQDLSRKIVQYPTYNYYTSSNRQEELQVVLKQLKEQRDEFKHHDCDAGYFGLF